MIHHENIAYLNWPIDETVKATGIVQGRVVQSPIKLTQS